MKKEKIFSVLESILSKKEKYFDKEQKVILRNSVSDDVENFNGELLELLMGVKELKEHFFKEVGRSTIFDKDKFLTFVNNKNFLPDSYTRFTQNIGLTEDDKFLKSSGKVVLNWPYKDCVLEGGQTKEDQKRNEMFFNEVLEKDEIDVLLKPKVFTNFRKYSLEKGEAKAGKFGEFSRNDAGTITDNLIIKGNNLLALHSLKEEFTGKVKLIYIDPPYNTGNDGFKYNDNFNHSTWLTFMKNRLEVARDLLSDDGVIFVQCDDNEQAYLKVLMDEIFEYQNFLNTISVKMNESKGLKNAHIEKKIPKNKEYIHIFSKNNFLFFPKKINKENYELKGYVKYYNKYISNISDNLNKWKLEKFEKGNDIETRLKYKKQLVYFVKPDNKISINLKSGRFGVIINKRGKKNIFYNDGKDILKVLFLSENTDKFLGDLWTHISTININKEGGGIKTLKNGQKPEELLKTILELSTKEDDLILDFFGGSGTSGAVAHKMNRQYILVEQMDYINDLPEARLKKVIEGEQGGISKDVKWKGGDKFVYMEMKEFNQDFLSQIKKAKDKKDLKNIFKTMKKQAFLSYRFSEKEFDEKISKFDKLGLNEQKKVLDKILDKNLLYLNLSEMEDGEFEVDKKEIEINKSFYE